MANRLHQLAVLTDAANTVEIEPPFGIANGISVHHTGKAAIGGGASAAVLTFEVSNDDGATWFAISMLSGAGAFVASLNGNGVAYLQKAPFQRMRFVKAAGADLLIGICAGEAC